MNINNQKSTPITPTEIMEQMWAEHHDPKERERQQLLLKRKNRAKIIKQDAGL